MPAAKRFCRERQLPPTYMYKLHGLVGGQRSKEPLIVELTAGRQGGHVLGRRCVRPHQGCLYSIPGVYGHTLTWKVGTGRLSWSSGIPEQSTHLLKVMFAAR